MRLLSMIITYHGGPMVKVQQGNLTLVFNPISKESSLRSSKFGADIALVSLHHPDYNGVDQLRYGDREPFVIDGPGEYERQGIFINGWLTPGPQGLINTVYELTLDELRLVHLGALASPDLSKDLRENLGAIDILLVPTGNGELLSTRDAYKLATSLGPAVIIPLAYPTGEGLEEFVKEAGEDKVKPIDKYTIKKKDLAEAEGEIVILSAV